MAGGAARSGRYSAEEIAALSFDGPAPAAADLSRRWHAMLAEATALIAALPAEQAGHCVLAADGGLQQADAAALREQLARGAVLFHEGRIRGALPQVLGT